MIQLKLPEAESTYDSETEEIVLLVREVAFKEPPAQEPGIQQNINNLEYQMPCKRTYHASTLLQRFMVIVGGESNQRGDLNDIWCLDLDSMLWYCPPVIGIKNFVAKRFHTANAFDNGTKVVTFGGC